MSTTSRQERRAERLDHPRFERYRNPRSRRALAGILVGVLAAEAVLIALAGLVNDSPTAAVVWMGGMGLLVVAFVLVLGTLKASTRGVEELSPVVLDERIIEVRGVIYTRAYRVLAVIVMAGALAVGVGQALGWSTSREVVLAALLMMWQIPVVLPALSAAFDRRV